MRKTLCFFLTALLILATLSSAASAVSAKLKTTLQFLDLMESEHIIYTNKGLDDDKDERVEVSFSLEQFDSATCVLYFRNDNHSVSLRIWNLITPSAAKDEVLSALNSLNFDIKYAKFVLDESDNTVQIEMDLFIDEDHCAQCVYDAMMTLLDIIEDEAIAQKLHALE